MPLFFQLLIVVTSLTGLGVVWYIHYHKAKPASGPMVCFLGADCHSVVTSQYSTLLGVPLEHWGFFYYGVTLAVYALTLKFVAAVNHPAVFWWGAASAVAFFVSIYLTYVQAVKLREWCTWCLCSAMLSSIIFLAVLGLRFGF